MSYALIQDFKAGIDRRKSIDTAPEGSLWDLVNAHITRGGEIEKRKAFATKYTLPAGTFGLHSANNQLYVFGSGVDPGVPSGVNYQRLQHSDSATSMSAVLHAESFDGKPYVIAEFTDGAIFHYYDAARVTSWDGIATSVSNNATVATALKNKIDDATAFTATTATTVVEVTAVAAGTEFSYSSDADNFGSVDDQTITETETQANGAETLSQGSVQITGGTSNPGTNTIDSITVNSVDILGAAVDHTGDDDTTATAVAAQIDAYTSATEYTVSVSTDTITITALAGTGATPNGYVVTTSVSGDPTAVDVDMGTVTAGVTAIAQIVEFEIGGTFESADVFTITLDGIEYVIQGNSSGTGSAATTHLGKVYSPTGSLLYFCALDNPTLWGSGVGAGWINLANQDAGSEELVTSEVYQQNLAVFAKRSIQIWSVEADDANNAHIQTLKNTGTRAPRSVATYGNRDLFYLSDSGVRSLKSRDSSNAAYTDDIGTPVDDHLGAYLLTVSQGTKEDAVSVIEPNSSRYWLAVGERIYVFSFFPSSKISAWSTYEPGFTASEFATTDDRVFARAANAIYLYGGDNNNTYDTSMVTVQLSFISSEKPATYKQLNTFDMSATNTWDVSLLVNPADLDQYVTIGTVTGFTYNQADIGVGVHCTHYAPKLTCSQAGAAKLNNLAFHMEMSEAS